MEEEVEAFAWTVATRQGPRRFQTRLDDWPSELPGGGLLIRDLAVPDPRAGRAGQEEPGAVVELRGLGAAKELRS